MANRNDKLHRKKRVGEIGFRFAIKGIRFLFQSQFNARIHGIITLLVILAGILFRINTWEWIVIILCIGGVFTSEMINTAFEYLTDIVSPEWDEKAGRIKDLSAGAVLVMVLVSVVCGVLIFAPKILHLICSAFGFC